MQTALQIYKHICFSVMWPNWQCTAECGWISLTHCIPVPPGIRRLASDELHCRLALLAHLETTLKGGHQSSITRVRV